MTRRLGILTRCAIGACLLAALSAGAAIAATRYVTVSPTTAAPGARVTVEIHEYGGQWWGTDLYLFPASGLRDGQHCGEMPGAVHVAVITWTHDGLDHNGSAEFTLPALPDGAYLFGEELGSVIPPCAPSGSLTISSVGVPNTAVSRAASGVNPWLVAVLLVSLAIVVARPRLRARRGS